MKVPVVVYFDTNIVRDLAERRLPQAKEKTTNIQDLITQEKVVIAPSFEVLYEILSAPDVSEITQVKNAQFYVDLVDWTYALKPSDQMLKDDISSCLRQGGPSTPYHAIDQNGSKFIHSIQTGDTILPPKAWKKVVKRSRCQNEEFVEKVFNDFGKKLPQRAKTQLRNHPEEIWQKWWSHGGMAEVIANSLAGEHHIQSRYSLLSLPSVRAGVGFILHTWYRQIPSGAKLKPTEHYDFRNAILGAAVGTIVTRDRKLRKAITHIPDLNVKTWTLEQFISKVM